MGIADLDPEFWRFGMTMFAFGAVSPWLSMLDADKYGRFIDRVQSLEATTIAACHTPVIEGPFIDQAFEWARQLPTAEAPPLPDQTALEQIVAATALPAS
jgi:hypothetical protein